MLNQLQVFISKDVLLSTLGSIKNPFPAIGVCKATQHTHTHTEIQQTKMPQMRMLDKDDLTVFFSVLVRSNFVKR